MSPFVLRKGRRFGLAALLRRTADVRPEEVTLVFWCWIYIFCVLSSYYVMRPIREQMGVAGGVANLPWLFTATLAGMLVANLPFALLVQRLPRSRFVPLVYRFFGLNILGFAAALHLSGPDQALWIGRAFFVWVSIYNLFVVSVFWQLNVDLFSPEQGRRLFGVISAGATIGAIFGSGITAGLARSVPPPLLLIAAAVLLEVAVLSASRLTRLSPASGDRRASPSAGSADQPVGGSSAIAGLTHAIRSPYLLGVSAFLLLFAITSTFLYFQQAAIVAASFSDRGSQTAFFATLDLCVNTVTLVIQLFVTGRVLGTLGIAVALALLPGLTALGFGVLAFAPTLATVAVFQVLRRSADYSIARPAREVLFTVVPREDRYKAKAFIDTFVYRLGDQVGAWSMALLGAISNAAGALVAILLAIAWLINALWLGRQQRSREKIAAEGLH